MKRGMLCRTGCLCHRMVTDKTPPGERTTAPAGKNDRFFRLSSGFAKLADPPHQHGGLLYEIGGKFGGAFGYGKA